MDPHAHGSSSDACDHGRSSHDMESPVRPSHNESRTYTTRHATDTMKHAGQGRATGLHMPHSPDGPSMQLPCSARTSDRRLYDPEKFSLPPSPRTAMSGAQVISPNRKHQEAMRLLKKDLGALVNFMSLIPFASIGIALYTLFALFSVVLLAPLNICIASRKSVSSQLRTLLVPATNLHYKCAWSSSCASDDHLYRSWPGSIYSHTSDEELHGPRHETDSPNNFLLVTVLFLSPVLSLPFVCAAFVVALWWIMSAITANDVADGFSEERPRREGQGGFDEGQRLARGLRHWWIGWLSGDKLR